MPVDQSTGRFPPQCFRRRSTRSTSGMAAAGPLSADSRTHPDTRKSLTMGDGWANWSGLATTLMQLDDDASCLLDRLIRGSH